MDIDKSFLLFSGSIFFSVIMENGRGGTRRKRSLGMDETTFEDLAFGIWSLREVDVVDLRVCLSVASYAEAEKAEWRMA